MARGAAGSGRIELRVAPADKAILAQAAALERTDLTGFILRNALPAARDVVARAERLELSARDSARVLDLLENPPPPTPRLAAAAKALARNERP